MNPVDHQVHVPVHSVPVGDDQYLVLLEAQVGEESVRNLVHLRGVHRIRGIEGEGHVVDRPLDSGGLRGRGAHQQTDGARVSGREVPRLYPVHPLRCVPFPAGFQVAGQPTEPTAVHQLCDHPILRTAA
jgi:hypothetical protein